MMHEMMLVGEVSGGIVPEGALGLKIVKSSSASTLTIVGRALIAEFTFDVPGSITKTYGDSGETSPIAIPANAGEIYIQIRKNVAATAAFIFYTEANSRITEVLDWGTPDPGLYLRLNYCQSLVKVPTVSPPWSNWNNLFSNAPNFNQDIGMWDTSHVTDIGSFFMGMTIFNKDISTWDVRNVTVMNYLFRNASTFNQNLSAMTFPKVSPGQRYQYDSGAEAWLPQNKPTFALN